MKNNDEDQLYPADIAGIMDCICRGLTDKSQGVEGAVIQSSDNDHDSGEIYVDTPQGKFTIKVGC